MKQHWNRVADSVADSFAGKNKTLSPSSEDFILTSDMYSPTGAAVWSAPADASVIAQDVLSHYDARFKLYLYPALAYNLDALDQPPDEVIVKLAL